MHFEPSTDFDIGALHAALDEARCSRGMSWRLMAQEISGLFRNVPARPISPSTLSGLRNRRSVEGDGVLLFAALDAQRKERGASWALVAADIGGVTDATLTGLSKGGRTSFPEVMRIARWLKRPLASFTRACNR